MKHEPPKPSPDFAKGVTSEKISAIFRRIERQRDSAAKARNNEKSKTPKYFMLAGKVRAHTQDLCLIHDMYPQNLEPGLWKGSSK